MCLRHKQLFPKKYFTFRLNQLLSAQTMWRGFSLRIVQRKWQAIHAKHCKLLKDLGRTAKPKTGGDNLFPPSKLRQQPKDGRRSRRQQCGRWRKQQGTNRKYDAQEFLPVFFRDNEHLSFPAIKNNQQGRIPALYIPNMAATRITRQSL